MVGKKMTGLHARSISGAYILLYIGTTFSVNVAKQITYKDKTCSFRLILPGMIFYTHFTKTLLRQTSFNLPYFFAVINSYE